MRAGVLIFLLALVGAGCATGGPEVSGDRRNVGGITMTFTVTPARVQVGRPVRLNVRLVNNTGLEERLTFPSGQLYDFWITRDGEEIWRWSADRVFVAAITHETISPHGSRNFTEPWTPESAGRYVAHGLLTAEGFARELTGELSVE